MDALAADDACARADARTVDDDAQRRGCVAVGLLDGGPHLGLVGDVRGNEGDAVDRTRSLDRLLQVESGDPGAPCGEGMGRGGTEPGGGTGDDGGGVGELHDRHPASEDRWLPPWQRHGMPVVSWGT